MDDRNENPSKGVLHQPFIHTANALASLYKQATVVEREARDSGARCAYQAILQWAARKSIAGESVSLAELMEHCSAELLKLPQPSQTTQAHHPERPATRSTPNATSNNHSSGNSNNSSVQLRNGSDMSLEPASFAHQQKDEKHTAQNAQVQQTSVQQQQHTTQPSSNASYVPRDEGLVSDIKKLNVNPRKRQRVDISDTFVKACGSVGNAAFLFSDEIAYGLRTGERSANPILRSAESGHSPSVHASRRENRDGRDGVHGPPAPEFHIQRSSKNAKAHAIEKLRKK